MRNVENHLAKTGEKLPYKAPTPLSSGYRPEIDVSPELGETDASHFHSLVGVLWWIVELGRVDIDVEVSMMSSHLALPRVGHLKEIYHIFAYLKAHSNTEMVFDLTPVTPDMICLSDRIGLTRPMDVRAWLRSCPATCLNHVVPR